MNRFLLQQVRSFSTQLHRPSAGLVTRHFVESRAMIGLARASIINIVPSMSRFQLKSLHVSSLSLESKPTSTVSTTTVPSTPPSIPSPHPTSASQDSSIISSLNEAISRYPLETVVSLALLEGLSFTVTKATFVASGIEFPTLFAVAFLLSMPLRRSVLPKLTVALPLTFVLRRIAPSLQKVHFSLLWKNRAQWMPEWIQKRFKRNKTEVTPVVTATPQTSEVKPNILVSTRTKLSNFVGNLSDKYGLALLISYRLAGCIIVNGVYYALSRGIDLTPVLHFFGYEGDLTKNSVLGSYAGAVVFGGLWFPITVFLAPYPAKLIYNIRNKLFSSSKPAVTAAVSSAGVVNAVTAGPETVPLPSAAVVVPPADSAAAQPAEKPADDANKAAKAVDSKKSL